MSAPEHKKELHQLVDDRHARLKSTLTSLPADQKESEKARAIEGSLAALETHISGGWDKVGEQESAAIVRWLDQSKFLVDDLKAATTPHTATTQQLNPVVSPEPSKN